jgi:uncharacterized protein YwgA
MEPKLAVLKLVLEELGVSSSIETVSDRKRVQKAVYLAQLSNLDLGYRYGWYLMGPYCPKLTQDYFELENETETTEGLSLNPNAQNLIARIKPLMAVPNKLKSVLKQEDWLELLASYDFLRRVSDMSHDNAVKTFEEKKPHLVCYIPDGQKALRACDLLQ